MSLILDMQKSIIDPNFNIRSLMFATLLASRKLGQNDIYDFCESEMNGYNDIGISVPSYRGVQTKIEYLDGDNEWKTVITSRETREKFLKYNVSLQENFTESIFRAADLSSRNEKFFLQINDYDTLVIQNNLCINTPVRKVIYPYEVQKIIDAVRLSILEWVIRLEQDGITGDGLSFSPEQIERASHVTFNVNNTGNMAGLTFGNNNTTTTTQSVGDGNNVDITKAKDLLAQIEPILGNLSLPPEKLSQAQDAIFSLNQEVDRENPDNSKIRGWFSNLVDAMANAGIPIVAKAFGQQIQGLLG